MRTDIMKGYISLTNLVRMLNKAVELDPRQVKDIAKDCGFEERTFRSIRKFNPRKPLQYLSERIQILNELTTEIVFEELPRIEVDGSRLELWTLLGFLDDVPKEYRGYKLRLDHDGRFYAINAVKVTDAQVEHRIDGTQFDDVDEALDDIKARIDDAIDAPVMYEGFSIEYTTHFVDHKTQLFSAEAFLFEDTSPRANSTREEVEMFLDHHHRHGPRSVTVKTDRPHSTKPKAFRSLKSEIDLYLAKRGT